MKISFNGKNDIKIHKITLADAIWKPNAPLKLAIRTPSLADAVTLATPPIKKSRNSIGKTIKNAILATLIIFSGAAGAHKARQAYSRAVNGSMEGLRKLSITQEAIDDFSGAIIEGRLAHLGNNVVKKHYKLGASKGINTTTTSDIEDLVLARNAERVAKHLKTSQNCYTGVKHSLLTSGVIDDYGAMPKGSAHRAAAYFKKHPDKFQQVTNNGAPLTAEQVRNLPAGHIVVYNNPGKHGHILITNGNGQGMSDSFDNMKYTKEYPNATFEVFKLSDGWKYNAATKGLEFKK